MMFMVGQGETVIAVGPEERHDCPRCGEVRSFQPQLKYKYGRFDLLFGFVYDKRYQLACLHCNHGWLLDTAIMERGGDQHPIPFRLRYGFAILAGVITALAMTAYWIRHAS